MSATTVDENIDGRHRQIDAADSLQRRFAGDALWILSFCCVAIAASCSLFAAELPGAMRDAAWDQAFTRTSGWTGGDVAGTIDLLDGRVLWVFGDSWIGPVEKGAHAAGTRLVNNAAAVHPIDASGAAPSQESITFLTGQEGDDGPAAWISDPKHREDATAKRWFWTSGGGITIADGDRRTLYVFLFRVERTQGNSDVWNFRIIGTTMAVFDDLDRPPEQWTYRLVDIPYSVEDANGAEGSKPWVAWGLAALRRDQQGSPEVYLYGVQRHSKSQNDLLVAKVAAADFEKFDRWQFRVGPNEWSSRAGDAQPVIHSIPTELSVEWVPELAQYVMIHSEPNLGTGISLRTAEQPDGPWSEPRTIYRVTDVPGDRRLFTYAAKGHAKLSKPGELLVTYIVNSNDFSAIVQDAALYRPRCLQIPLRR